MTFPRGGLAILVFVLGACTRCGAEPPQANTLQRAPDGLVTDARGVVTVKEEAIDPARAAVDLLAATPGIDPNRIVVVGHSEGGSLAPRIAQGDGRVAGLGVPRGEHAAGAGPRRRTGALPDVAGS
jgi:dienelactone hydrolase